jgi:hypothetical protein
MWQVHFALWPSCSPCLGCRCNCSDTFLLGRKGLTGPAHFWQGAPSMDAISQKQQADWLASSKLQLWPVQDAAAVLGGWVICR